MNRNLANALHGLQECRTAIMIETGDAETHEQMDALTDMENKLNEVEVLIKEYKRNDS